VKRRNFLVTAAALAAMPGLSQEREEGGHAAFRPDPRLEEIFRDLSAPLHARLLRDPARAAVRGQEADLSRGYALEISDPRLADRLSVSTADFNRFMSVSMGVKTRSAGYPIHAAMAALEGCPAGAPEAFHLRVTDSAGEITARGADGIRRALIYLEDEMVSRGGPFLPLGPASRWAVVEDRITRSPVAPYRWHSGWELEHDQDYYPDEYLNKLAHCGMNGIWVACLLSRLVASKTLPELGPDSHDPLEKLKRLTERAGRYGIKVYLFCIEPRALPADHPALAAHPEIRGAEGRGWRCLCVSSPVVQQYIHEVMRELFTEVPDLAGVINIYKGERPTTRWMNDRLAQTCPRCRLRTQVDVLSDDLNCFMEGIRQASATAKFLAWGYGGNRATDFTAFLPRVHGDIIWLGNFEHGGEKIVNGKRVGVREYSLSYIGPSEPFARVTREAVKAGHDVFAKLQIGNTYELSSVPHIPVPQIVYDKLAALRELSVKGAMMSWIIGGFPSPLLKVAGESSFAPPRPRQELLTRVAAGYWGPRQADRVVAAWDQFSQAFQLYLCAIEVFYFGPITRCPSYQLHLEREMRTAQPYNWGLTRDRIRQPYEDQVSRWLGGFSADDLIASFREMGAAWAKGLDILADCLRTQPDAVDLRRQHAVGAAARLQFFSMANALEFYTLRDQLASTSGSESQRLVRRLRALAADDIALAEQMKRYVALDCTIGWESEIYDYSYSEPRLEEKIRHDRGTLHTLARWEEHGIEPEVLAAMLPTPAPPRPEPEQVTWREWLRWGD
jgi:hypothetical protein